MTGSWKLLKCLALAVAISATGSAQSGDSDTNAARVISPTRGFQPGHSYALSDIESIDQASGAVSLHIPLAQLPAGPAGFTAGVTLAYSSKYWEVEPNPGTSTAYQLKQSTAGGWRLGLTPVLEREILSNRDLSDPCGPSTASDLFQLRIITPDGSRHSLLLSSPTITTSLLCEPGTYSMTALMNAGGIEKWYSTDGSYLRLVIDTPPTAADLNSWPDDVSWTLYRTDGSSVRHLATGAYQLKDRNGNVITVTHDSSGTHLLQTMTDAFGRSISVDTDGSTNTDTITQKVNDDDGNALSDLTWVVHYALIPPTGSPFPSYRCVSGSQQFNCTFPSTLHVVSSIDLPNGLSYSFSYAGSTYGEISSVTLPTGASVAYTYHLEPHCGIACYFDVLGSSILSKVATHDGTTDTWSYNFGVNPNGAITGSSITAPDGATTTYSYDPIEYQFSSSPYGGVITKTSYPDGSITQREWADNRPSEVPSNLLSANRWVARELTTTANTSGSPVATSIRVFAADKNGNTTTQEERGWVAYSTTAPASSAATLLRKTVTQYVVGSRDSTDTAADSNAYSNPSFSPRPVNLPASVEVQSAGGAVVSRSTFEYQETTPSRMVGNLVRKLTWDSTKASIATGAPLCSGGADSGCGPNGNAIASQYTYTANGNLLTATDSKGHATTYAYGAIAGCPGTPGAADLYRTTMSRGGGTSVQQNWAYSYNCSSAQLHSVTDPNSVTTTVWHDRYARPTTITESATASGATTNFRITVHTYNDSSRWIVTQNDVAAYNDKRNVSVLYFDQLGRVTLQRQLEASVSDPTTAANQTGGIQTKTVYKLGSGRNETWVSNPFVDSSSPQGWTVERRDNMGRSCMTEWFAGGTDPVVTAGCGAPSAGTTGNAPRVFNASVSWTSEKITDAAGVQRVSYHDVLGRLVAVVEDPSGLKYTTYYGYDLLGDLKNVQQVGTCANTDPVATPCTGGQSRTFDYTSLKRLSSAQNPESGTITYTYDAVGNLIQRQHGSLTVQNTYDDLDRIITQTYSGDSTPAVSYTYDTPVSAQKPNNCAIFDGPIGRLSKVDNTVSTSYYFYNRLGYPQCYRQSTGSTAYDSTYSTTPQGVWNQVVYPSGRTVTTTFNDRGLPTSVGAYATQITYWPHGALNQVVLGNGLNEQNCYNSRLQMSGQRTGVAAFNTDCSNQSADLLSLGFGYSATANNGNLQTQTINVPWSDVGGSHTQSMTQTYTYDTLNRLSGASESVTGVPSGINSAPWSWTFGADQYGNLWGTNTLGLAALMPPAPTYFDTSNNRLKKYGATPGTDLPSSAYDSNTGNLQQHPDLCQNGATACMQYDGEGRLVKATNGANVAQYDYDGEGRRVRKTETGSTQVTTVYVHDAAGNLMAEYNIQGGTVNSGVQYLTDDHLGSTRLVTDGAHNVVQRFDYFPFGQTIPSGESYGNRNSSRIAGYGSTTNLTIQFTGKERGDSVAEGGLDYFGARYFSGTQGRWTTPDWSASPEPLRYANLRDPQTLNLYVYVRNNPLKIRDLDGHGWWGDLWRGLADHTYRPLVTFAKHPIVTARNLGSAVTHPVATARAIKTGVVTTTINVFHGNGEAIGTAIGTVGMVFIPGVGEAGEGAEAVEAVAGVGEVAEAAESTANAAKALASDLQVREIMAGGGTPLAGAGAKTGLRDAARLAAKYGGKEEDWVKVGSSTSVPPGGAGGWDWAGYNGSFEVHAYKNVKTGEVVELKTKFQ